MRSAPSKFLSNNAAFQRTYDKFEDIFDDEFEETLRITFLAHVPAVQGILPPATFPGKFTGPLEIICSCEVDEAGASNAVLRRPIAVREPEVMLPNIFRTGEADLVLSQ
jgi:hypothetical protein